MGCHSYQLSPSKFKTAKPQALVLGVFYVYFSSSPLPYKSIISKLLPVLVSLAALCKPTISKPYNLSTFLPTKTPHKTGA
jgi:hypothetical protein